jgi:hypothetical protein
VTPGQHVVEDFPVSAGSTPRRPLDAWTFQGARRSVRRGSHGRSRRRRRGASTSPIRTRGRSRRPAAFCRATPRRPSPPKGQIVIAADVITGGNERHRLEPIVTAAREELQAAGITDAPEVVLADAGFWNSPHIEALAHEGLRALVKPDADSRKARTRARSGPA